MKELRILKEGSICGRVKLIRKVYNESMDRMEWKCQCTLCRKVGNYSFRSLIRSKNVCRYCSKVKDVRGKLFTRLYVDELLDLKDGARWICTCTCPEHNKVIVSTKSLMSGNTRSCGCLNDEARRERAKHGDWNTQFYRCWQHIKDRCNNPNNEEYHNYGGRGITYDPRWKEYENFKEDMYESYVNYINIYGDKDVSIDRINNDGNYYKKNCRWCSHKEQQRNKRTNKTITFRGIEYSCTQEMIEKTFYNYYNENDLRRTSSFISTRVNNGWSPEEAMIIPSLDINKDTWYKMHHITEADLPNVPIKRVISYIDKKEN